MLSFNAFAKNVDDTSFFDKTVSDLLQEKITDERLSVEPEYNSQSKIANIRSKEDKIRSVELDKFDPQISSFALNVLYLDGTSESISGKYVLYIEIPVAARYIKFGEVIQSLDVKNVKAKFNQNADIISVSEIVGMQAKKYIPMGSVIKRVDIVSPPVIKNNDPVNIIYSSGVINLKTSGIAMGSGAIGDMIKVKNSTSGIVLLGQIVNKNTVQVSGNNDE